MRFVTWLALAVLLITASGSLAADEIFRMEDPPEDDCGPGSYSYPIHEAFAPHCKLFDLTSFLIWKDDDNYYFDATFQEVTNPWEAPEGFFHQLIDIYIDAVPKQGETKALGPNVAFEPEYGWDFRVKVVPFGGSRLFGAGVEEGGIPVKASLLPDEKTIRVQVPADRLQKDGSWNLFVLIGSYDFFGPDNYRLVAETADKWSFGGGGTPWHPRVIDLLAPQQGQYSQEQLLASFDPASQKLARLSPVQKRGSLPGWWMVGIGILVVVFASGGWIYYRKVRTPPVNS